jgi:hypothetical protein
MVTGWRSSSPAKRRKVTLEQLARERGLPKQVLLARLVAGVTAADTGGGETARCWTSNAAESARCGKPVKTTLIVERSTAAIVRHFARFHDHHESAYRASSGAKRRSHAASSREADDGSRTRDLRLGKPTLYRLSYVRARAES